VVQRRFDFGPLPVAPLWSINGVMGILKKDADEVLALILEGKIPWAWDISTKPETRAEWRIWPESVRAYQRSNPSLPSLPSVKAITENSHAEVLCSIIGHSRPVLRGSEIRSIWTCDQQVITRHLRLANLQLDPSASSAAHVSPRIARASFEIFMQSRCTQQNQQRRNT